MDTIFIIHIAAVAFWFGLVGAEFVIERSRAETVPHGFAVARNHYYIDLFLEMPTFIVVLVTGAILMSHAALTSLLITKMCAGLVAVISNFICLYPVIKRKLAADQEDLKAVIAYSKQIDRISVLALPAGFIALIIGIVM
ncbi:MAG: hypothetical protein MI864_08200 [Pseudomonadales bacterium]|nr:hypothetical protein [Pseudomonadales bacterium]